jgi:hypothetical protein
LPNTLGLCGLTDPSYTHPVVILKCDCIQKGDGKSEVEITFAKVRARYLIYSQSLILIALQIGSWHRDGDDTRLKLTEHNERKQFLLVYVDPGDSVVAEYPGLEQKLLLEEGKKMDHTSWVLCPHYHTMPLKEFKNFRGESGARPYHYRLEKSSYKQLMQHLKLPHQDFTLTKDLKDGD